MLRVKTFLKHSPTHGIGLFAAEPIKEGTVTWEYDPEFDTAYTSEEVERMPKAGQALFWKYEYFDKELGKYVLCSDDQRFINHSTTGYNIQSTPHRDVANRDIKAGEELLCNYNDFDDTYASRLPPERALFKEELNTGSKIDVPEAVGASEAS